MFADLFGQISHGGSSLASVLNKNYTCNYLLKHYECTRIHYKI